MKSNRRSDRPYTAETFAFAARGYLERFPCSMARFEDVLRRKFKNKKQEAEESWIKDAIEFGVRNGFLDDDMYAQGVFNSLTRKGLPPFQIRQKMMIKQIDKARIQSLIETIPTDTDAQREAVAIYGRRKRLGVYRTTNMSRLDQKERDKKDYERLRRAGFAHDVALWFLHEHAESD